VLPPYVGMIEIWSKKQNIKSMKRKYKEKDKIKYREIMERM
jgi:hypothetical protein